MTAMSAIIAQNTVPDTLAINVQDSIKVSRDSIPLQSETGSKSMLDGKIEYAAADSISFDIRNKMAYMYGDAAIKYQDITLKAAVIIIDFNRSMVTANVVTDSTGKSIGIPDFTQGTMNFKSNSLSYNFATKKGLIKNVITEKNV